MLHCILQIPPYSPYSASHSGTGSILQQLSSLNLLMRYGRPSVILAPLGEFEAPVSDGRTHARPEPLQGKAPTATSTTGTVCDPACLPALRPSVAARPPQVIFLL